MSESGRISSAQWKLASLILALALARILHGVLVHHHLRQTAALFIGLPAFLAIILVLTPKAKSLVGSTVKGLTIAMLLSGIFLLEGFVCIVMAAPIFYAVAIVISAIVQISERQSNYQKTLRILLLPLLAMSLEGTSPALSFERSQTVTLRRQVSASATEIETALASEPRFDRQLPLYLQLGFPRPVYSRGHGLGQGDTRTIGFAVGKQTPHEIELQVVESRPGLVIFQLISDQTPISDWLRWQQAVVEWHEIAPGLSTVSWTFHYQRELDPAWYFGPMQRYAVGLTAGYLIDTVATP